MNEFLTLNFYDYCWGFNDNLWLACTFIFTKLVCCWLDFDVKFLKQNIMDKVVFDLEGGIHKIA